MGVHVFPIWTPLPPLSPSHHSGLSQCTSPERPVSCIEPGLAICFTYDNIHVSRLFSQIIPPSPSPTLCLCFDVSLNLFEFVTTSDFFFLIGESLLYNVVLVSAIQHESAISVYIVPPFWASFLLPITLLNAITEYQVELPVSYSNFPVAIYFTHDNIFILPMIMYIFQCLSPFVPSSPSPAVFTSTFLHLCLYSFPANKILIPFF